MIEEQGLKFKEGVLYESFNHSQIGKCLATNAVGSRPYIFEMITGTTTGRLEAFTELEVCGRFHYVYVPLEKESSADFDQDDFEESVRELLRNYGPGGRIQAVRDGTDRKKCYLVVDFSDDLSKAYTFNDTITNMD